MIDLVDLLGKCYGGWYDVCCKYGIKDGKWIVLLLGVIGNVLVYCESQIKVVGFDVIFKDMVGFFKLCQVLKVKDILVGFVLGKVVGDVNNWVYWLLWLYGGKLVDKNGQVVINLVEICVVLEYVKQFYVIFVFGILLWQDLFNNKVYLDGQISFMVNGILVYYVVKNLQDFKLQDIVKDIQYVYFLVGLVGKFIELMQIMQMMVFKYIKYFNVVKVFVQFMFELDQYNLWMKVFIGYVSQLLKVYEKNLVWIDDLKVIVYCDLVLLMLDYGYEGLLGQVLVVCMVDYVVVDMVVEVVLGVKIVQQVIDCVVECVKWYYKI